jgi:DNA primase
MITKDTIDTIFSVTRIEEVIGDFVTLKRSGSNYKALSPFSQEKTPSFYISPAKQIFKDFSSGKGGNAVTFLMEHEQMSYPDALRYLASKYGIEIKEEQLTPEKQEEADKRESLFIVNTFAQKFFSETLFSTDEGKAVGLSYFKERGINKESIETFYLGYSPEDSKAFFTAARSKGHKPEYLLATGLIKERNGDYYDAYRGRVVFPIHNLSGRVIGFGARTLKSDKNVPKYINSPENDIYHKSHVLYGIYQAKSEIVKQDTCLLVEGYTDVISMHQAGIKNVVASSGTALTIEQIRLIKRYTQNVSILYDGDVAGIKASFRGIDLILEEGLNVKVVLFPDGDDPDSFARKNDKEQIATFIQKESKDFIRFKTSVLLEETQGDPIKKAALVHQIVNSIALIPDQIARSIYTQECSNLLDIPERALIAELNKQLRSRADEKRKQKLREEGKTFVEQERVEVKTESYASYYEEEQKLINSFELEFQEKDLIRLMLNYGKELIPITIINEEGNEEDVSIPVVNFIVEELLLDEIEFDNEQCRLIFSELARVVANDEELTTHYFTGNQNEKVRQLATELLTERYTLANWEERNIFVSPELHKLPQAVKGSIYGFKERYVSRMISKFQEEIKRAYEVGEDFIPLLTQQRKLEKIRTALSLKQGKTILK